MEKVEWCLQKLRNLLAKMYTPAVSVGNKERVRKKGEPDSDADRLSELTKVWRQMLHDDPWRKKLMTHVGLLTTAMGIFFLMFWLGGLYLPTKHPLFNYIGAGIFSTIPYWLWVGKWHARIEKKVFEAFKKKFGKHFHLK